MSAFAITEAAVAEVQRIFGQTKCRNPVAKLYERADAGHLFAEFKTALRDGTSTREDLSAVGRKRFAEVADQLESSLAVGVHERVDFRPEDLCEVSGITFVMGITLREMLSQYRLAFENGRFLLLDAHNATHTLRSLAKGQSGTE